MKKDILIFGLLTVIAVLILVFTPRQNPIDIQFHDTYLVLDATAATIVIIAPLTFLIFLVRGLSKKFKATGANLGLIIGLGLISLIFFRIAKLQSNYRDQIESNFEVSALQPTTTEREQFVNEINKKIMLTWGLFGICIGGIGVIGFRTYKILTRFNGNTTE